MTTVEVILEKAARASQAVKDEKRAALVSILFLDRNRETLATWYSDHDVEYVRNQLQDLLDEGARPVCILILPLGKPVFCAIEEPLSLDDQAVIDSMMTKCEGGPGAIVIGKREEDDNGSVRQP
jgi:hypothetical protein